jgi:glycosyltransferase involved in cell wall biosynthesis
MITAGFTLIGRGAWSGGETYQRNMFGVMKAQLAGKIQAKLFLSPDQFQKIGSRFDAFLAAPAIVDERVSGAGVGKSALRAMVRGHDVGFGQLVKSHGVDVMFESAQWFGNAFPVPVVSWIPDFQHRHMQQLFSSRTWWRRDVGFRIQTSGRRIIMLSSEDAKQDCEAFYKASVGKTAVVKFAIDLDPATVVARASEVFARYKLPDRFFYLPNQFWSHKNHVVLVEALKLLKASGDIEHVPPVVLTGRTEDQRDPTLYSRLIADVSKYGLETHFRHLGLVPYEDVFLLNAAASHLINPSKFEGWSTTVEEAKALGTQMILSDIGIHREQAPNAQFFAVDQPDQLAQILLSIGKSDQPPRPSVSTLAAQHAQRRHDYSSALYSVFQRAIDNGTKQK